MTNSAPLPAANATTSPSMRKAAVLISSLPIEEAAHLTRSLDRQQLERLADAIAVLQLVKANEQNKVAKELVVSRNKNKSTIDFAETSRCEPQCDRFDSADPAIVALILNDELPQTIAAVLCQMSASTSAEVLKRMSTDRQLLVVKRLAAIKQPDVDAITTLIESVGDAVERRSRPLRTSAGGETFLAHIVHCADRATEKALLENLVEEDRPLVDRLLQRIYLLKDSRRPTCARSEESESRKAG